jgi:FemAB-related protein (PEP-CTERM system-associated)
VRSSPVSGRAPTSVLVREEPLPGPPDGWDAYLERHPGATFFHRIDWLRVVTRAFRYRPLALAARREGAVAGILPLAVVPGLPWGRSLISTPQAVYGGALADDEESLAALYAAARERARDLGARYVEYRNVDPVPGLPAKDLYVTFRRPIAATADENMALIPRNQRRSIRVGIKRGYVSLVGGSELLAEFYAVYSVSVRNLGTPVFPRALFAGLLEAFPRDARILLVRREGSAVAGVLTLFFRGQVLPYYGGALKEEFRHGVNDFMYWQLHVHGMEQGYRIFDFGRSKRGSGSFDFKRHWGFEPTQLHYQYDLVGQREIPDLSPRNPRFSLAITAWKRMPLWLSRRLGPALVRYFP